MINIRIKLCIILIYHFDITLKIKIICNIHLSIVSKTMQVLVARINSIDVIVSDIN